MTDKEFKRLKRPELFEILLAQSREIDALKAKNEALTRQLESRRIDLEQAGSIAQAALQLNHIFEKAQAAADLYVENVAALYQEGRRPADFVPMQENARRGRRSSGDTATDEREKREKKPENICQNSRSSQVGTTEEKQK